MTDFAALLRALATEKVEFIVIGGVAATVHGAARATQDLDVVYRRSRANMARIVAALSTHQPYPRGAPLGLPFRFDLSTLRNGLNFTFHCDLGDIDLLGEVTGAGSYDALADHCTTVRAFGIECLVIDLETLIHVKRAAGRPKDFEALAELEAIWDEREHHSPHA